jgi:outer membrane protein insertion porin family
MPDLFIAELSCGDLPDPTKDEDDGADKQQIPSLVWCAVSQREPEVLSWRNRMKKRVTPSASQKPLSLRYALLLFFALISFSSGIPAQSNQPESAISQEHLANLSFPVRVASAVAQQPQQPGVEPEVPIENIEIRGNRRFPRESILFYVQSKEGDRFNREQATRDLQAVLGTGWFDPLQTRLLEDVGPRGGKILIFQVKEYPIIRDIQYRNMKSATESEVLTRFKEKSVRVGKEQQLDPAKLNGARIVVRDLLAEKGHPDAKVEAEIQEISATAVAVVFNVNEGPRVRVKEIVFTGQTKFSQRQLRRAMKYVKESGILSSFTSKDIYFKDKLEADLQGQLRQFLGNKGYLRTIIGEPKIERVENVSSGFPVPFLRKSGPGLRLTIPIELGRRYKVSKVEEKGVTLFPQGTITLVTGLRVGEYATSKAIQEGVYKRIKDLYGGRGYIQASAEFIPNFIDKMDEEGEVEVTLEVEEGKQYALRRLEFIGNTNTRDIVMRREVLLSEGDPYSKSLWDYSLLRLNQLGLFEEIKDKDVIVRTLERTQEVDLDVTVKERGRQQIQLNGGVSGIGGSFVGISYSTNNLLGYGESLNFDIASGNRQKSLVFGLNEPYLLGRPISAGIQLFYQEYQFIGDTLSAQGFNQSLQASLFGLSSVNADTLFTQKTFGGTISTSAPLKLFTGEKFSRFAGLSRIGLSYSLTSTRLQDPKVNRDNDPNTPDVPVTFSQPSVLTSRVTPSLSYNTLNSFLDPTSGQSLFLGFSLAGGILGGDVRTFAPSLEYKYFRSLFRRNTETPHVLGVRVLASHIRSYGKPFDSKGSFSFIGGIPTFERFFLGGEDTIRGYNIRSVGPLVLLNPFSSTQNIVLKEVDPTDSSKFIDLRPDTKVDPSVIRALTFDAPQGNCLGLTAPDAAKNCNVVQQTASYYPVGGDTQFLFNVEYRVPIFTQKFQAVGFADVGTAFNARKYNDQIVTTPFNKGFSLTPNGLLLNPSGRIATDYERAELPADSLRTIYAEGESRQYSIARLSQGDNKAFSNLIASMGLELRLQMPVINVPFRLIFAYNPKANENIDFSNTQSFFAYYFRGLERKTVIRFSVGRTF